jgi:mannose-6-phosphate isomerase-like protein (cupin superfamily)
MTKTITAFTLAMTLVAAVSAAQGAAPPPPAAPPAGSPATYKSEKELLDVLAKATARAGMTTSNIAANDQYSINIVHRDEPAGAVAHAGNTELHYIIEGVGTIVTGGTIVRGAAPASATIENGITRRVTKGDVVIVPANTPHWYKEIDGAITYLEVRWLAPK